MRKHSKNLIKIFVLLTPIIGIAIITINFLVSINVLLYQPKEILITLHPGESRQEFLKKYGLEQMEKSMFISSFLVLPTARWKSDDSYINDLQKLPEVESVFFAPIGTVE